MHKIMPHIPNPKRGFIYETPDRTFSSKRVRTHNKNDKE